MPPLLSTRLAPFDDADLLSMRPAIEAVFEGKAPPLLSRGWGAPLILSSGPTPLSVFGAGRTPFGDVDLLSARLAPFDCARLLSTGRAPFDEADLLLMRLPTRLLPGPPDFLDEGERESLGSFWRDRSSRALPGAASASAHQDEALHRRFCDGGPPRFIAGRRRPETYSFLARYS